MKSALSTVLIFSFGFSLTHTSFATFQEEELHNILLSEESNTYNTLDQTYDLSLAGAPSPNKNFTGWNFKDGVWSYYRNGVLQKGWIWVDTAWYYLDENGAMKTGWFSQSGNWYYLNSSGAMQRGWSFVNGRWFFMNSSGVMQTGWLSDNGKKYYLFNDGAMAKGWQFIMSEWYLFAENGAMQTGWVTQGGSKYYLDSNGVMARGSKTIDNKKYFFNASGIMQTGWVQVNGIDCYFNDDGVYDAGKTPSGSGAAGAEEIKNGWVQENDNMYFYVNGTLQKGWFWSGEAWYYFDPETGARKYGWLNDNGSIYYLDTSGKMHRGWLFINSDKKWYYFDSSGQMQTGTICVNGKYFLMDSDGVYIREVSNPNAITTSYTKPTNSSPTKGIDISTWQGDNIDWNAVKNSGVEYVMIRSNFGWTGVDNRFAKNITGAYNAGLKVGIYLYSYATNTEEAIKEFENLKRTIEPYRNMISFPVAYDIEDHRSQGSLSVNELTDIVVTFCDLVKDAGYKPMVYASVSWLEKKLDYNRIKNYDIWVAQYYSVCQYTYPYNMWQHSSSGSVDGIEGNVDMNWCYGLKSSM